MIWVHYDGEDDQSHYLSIIKLSNSFKDTLRSPNIFLQAIFITQPTTLERYPMIIVYYLSINATFAHKFATSIKALKKYIMEQ